MTSDSDIKTAAVPTPPIKITPAGNDVARDPNFNPLEKILCTLCSNQHVFFKSQQINDPDLTTQEKREIAVRLLDESHSKFLERFGKHLTMENLDYFEGENCSKNIGDDVQYLVCCLKKRLNSRHRDIKNRRFAAMKTMIKENSYFTEKEMMHREPYLYEQYIGKYLTEREKKLRDHVEHSVFSEVLLEGIEKEQTDELRKIQEQDDFSDYSSECSGTGEDEQDAAEEATLKEGMFPTIPDSFRRQWGEFEDEKKIKDPQEENNRESKPQKNKSQKYITADEREILSQEFVQTMYSKFLNGEDKDFNYTEIDNNSDLDDMEMAGQDNEDKYFDEDDDDDDDEPLDFIRTDHEADELDAYMNDVNT